MTSIPVREGDRERSPWGERESEIPEHRESGEWFVGVRVRERERENGAECV